MVEGFIFAWWVMRTSGPGTVTATPSNDRAAQQENCKKRPVVLNNDIDFMDFDLQRENTDRFPMTMILLGGVCLQQTSGRVGRKYRTGFIIMQAVCVRIK